jgi:hypothetical protein
MSNGGENSALIEMLFFVKQHSGRFDFVVIEHPNKMISPFTRVDQMFQVVNVKYL